MTEREWWGKDVRPALHRPQVRHIAWKTQDAFHAGMPDCYLVAGGESAWMEIKFFKALPKRPTTSVLVPLSANQKNRLDENAKAGGRSFVLVGVEETKEWFLFHHQDLTNIGYDAVWSVLAETAVMRGTYDKKNEDEGRQMSAIMHALRGNLLDRYKLKPV